jgi:hypothetical protein
MIISKMLQPREAQILASMLGFSESVSPANSISELDLSHLVEVEFEITSSILRSECLSRDDIPCGNAPVTKRAVRAEFTLFLILSQVKIIFCKAFDLADKLKQVFVIRLVSVSAVGENFRFPGLLSKPVNHFYVFWIDLFLI